MLVTGGAGWVGARVSDALIGCGHRVVVFDDMSAPHAADNARWLDRRRNSTGLLSFVFRDVRDGAELERALGGIDAVLHGAAPERGANDALELAVRVHGTLAILGAIERRAPAAHLVVFSDSAVYGSPVMVRGGTAMFAAREAQVLAPESANGAAAACAEQYALAAARGAGANGMRRATALRLPEVYASDSLYAGSDAFPARLAAAAHSGGALASNSDPRWPYDLVHVSDVARAVLAILEKPDRSVGEVFNVGGGARKAPSVWDLMQHLGTVGGCGRLTPPLAGARPTPVLDITRIGRALSWEPALAWRDGMTLLFAAAPASEARIIEPGAQALVAWPRAEGLA